MNGLELGNQLAEGCFAAEVLDGAREVGGEFVAEGFVFGEAKDFPAAVKLLGKELHGLAESVEGPAFSGAIFSAGADS